jgi:hypothetical protein
LVTNQTIKNHNIKMTKDQIKHLLPIISAFAEGKQVQLNCGGKWIDFDTLDFSASPHHYRIKPTPTLRPWRAEEVPVGALIRNKQRDSEQNRYLIIAVNGDYVAAGRGMYEHLNVLFNNSEHSLDHGKTWLPCGVVTD